MQRKNLAFYFRMRLNASKIRDLIGNAAANFAFNWFITMITCKNVRAAMINLCFSLQSHTFIARLKHTNSGKKASCARQNAAFTPRKSIRSTISRYDIGFRTTLQKNNTQQTKNNMLGSARNRDKSGKIGRLYPSDVRFSTRIPVRKCSEQEQTQKTGPFPFRMSFFPLKSRIIG